MFKAFFYGLILGVLLTGIGWFSIGRSDINAIRETVKRTDLDLERSERLVGEFEYDLGRYTDTFSVRVTEAGSLRDGIGELRERFSSYVPEVGDIRGELEYIAGGVTSVEDSIQRVVIINRDFADLLYEYRRLGKESETPEQYRDYNSDTGRESGSEPLGL